MQIDSQILSATEKGSFVTVHLHNEGAYGEVFHEFHQQFQQELGPVWTLIDQHRNCLEVMFNQSVEFPRITEGWMNLRAFYNLTGDHLIYFNYLGNSIFRISVETEESPPDLFPSYHSSSRGGSFSFELKLCESIAKGNQLTLKKDFADFVRNSVISLGYRRLYLCGPNIETACDLLITDEDTRTVKIGFGWKEFCRLNKFRKGNKLRFEFINVNLNNVVVVKRV